VIANPTANLLQHSVFMNSSIIFALGFELGFNGFTDFLNRCNGQFKRSNEETLNLP
jgi:hypothetical protein